VALFNGQNEQDYTRKHKPLQQQYRKADDNHISNKIGSHLVTKWQLAGLNGSIMLLAKMAVE